MLFAGTNRPKLLLDCSTSFRFFGFLGSIAQALGYVLCSLKVGMCEILGLPLILESDGDGDGESRMAQCEEGRSQL